MSRVKCLKSVPFLAPDRSSRKFLYEAGKIYEVEDDRVLKKLLGPTMQVGNRMVSFFRLAEEGEEEGSEEDLAETLPGPGDDEDAASSDEGTTGEGENSSPVETTEAEGEEGEEGEGQPSEPWTPPEDFNPDEWPRHVGGGNWDLPNGDRVKGKVEAEEALKTLLGSTETEE